MAKWTKRPTLDDPALVEPKGFEELVARANERVGDPHCRLNYLMTTCPLRRTGEMWGGNIFWASAGAFGAITTVIVLVNPSTFAIALGLLLYGASVVGGLGALAHGWRAHRRAHRNEERSSGETSRCISAYLGKLIAEERRRCIGDDSEIERLRRRVDRVLDRARTLRERLTARVSEERYRSRGDGAVPAYLTAAHQRAERVLERLSRSHERLSQHRAKLDAFFQECTARVQAAEKPLRDLELVEAVEQLDVEGERLGTEVQEVIIRSTGELFGRLQQLRSTLGVSLAHAGVHLALTAPMTGNLERDTSVLEDTIARFRPPKIVEDDAMASRAQASSPIGVM